MKNEKSNRKYNRIEKSHEADDRYDRIIADNAERRIEEEEEYIRSQLVQDIEATMKTEDNYIDDQYDYSDDPYKYSDDPYKYSNDPYKYSDDPHEYSKRQNAYTFSSDYNNQRDRFEDYKTEYGNNKNYAYNEETEDDSDDDLEISEKDLRKEARRKKREAKRKANRNKPFSRVTYLFVVLFLGLMAYLVYFNIVKAPDIINSPYNTRADILKEQVIKGKILASDGQVLAETKFDDNGQAYRYYPFGSTFAHVIGYDVNGKSGLESSENLNLLTSHAFFLEKMLNEFKEEKNTGDNVITTLDPELQMAAYNALGDSKGSVVAIEPSTGKIKVMLSNPGFDPNSVEEDWDYLINDEENSPLLNRATFGLYPPGSVFKIITSLEYIRENTNYIDYTYECNGSITEGETTIDCFNQSVHGSENFFDSFAYSCNSSFANIGLNLDNSAWRQTAENLLFNSDMPGRINAAKTSFKVDTDSGYATKMMTAMGQGETLTNPYHMALIVSAIANGGTLMIPYLIDRVENYSGALVKSHTPKIYAELMETSEAAVLAELMKGVVSYGTAYELSDEGYTAAGKTGTAEYSDDKSKAHSWFVGYSNVDNPDLVVAVIVEGYDGNSSKRSIPIAQAIFDEYYY